MVSWLLLSQENPKVSKKKERIKLKIKHINIIQVCIMGVIQQGHLQWVVCEHHYLHAANI